MNRVHLLRPSIDSALANDIEVLVAIAQQQLTAGQDNNAVDLLRAAEHLSFAALPGERSVQAKISQHLLQAIRAQFDQLASKAAEHWEREPEHHALLSGIYDSTNQRAATALRVGNHHQALELQRAAEALTHVTLHGPQKLARKPKQRQLAAS
jgi:hypothetical protein